MFYNDEPGLTYDDVLLMPGYSEVLPSDIVSAMKLMEKVLRTDASSNKEKREALRMLVHFVGDIHQPLHVGNGKDRGANNCWINWFPPYYTPPINKAVKATAKYVTLHELWDLKVIESMDLSYTEYAQKLLIPNPATLSEGDPQMEEMYSKYSGKNLKKLHKTKVKLWKKNTYIEWANESSELRKIAYLDKITSDNSITKFCTYSKDSKLNIGDIPNVGYEYRYKLGKIINLRLLQAGVRLGSLLDSIF